MDGVGVAAMKLNEGRAASELSLAGEWDDCCCCSRSGGGEGGEAPGTGLQALKDARIIIGIGNR